MASGSSGRALARLCNSSLLCSFFARNVSSRATAAISNDVAGSTILTKPSVESFFQQARGLADGPSAGMKNADEDVPSMPRLTSTGTMGRRFYKKAHMKPAEDGLGYLVLLDDRVLKTPAKKPLKVRNPALALAIAAEWEWQPLRSSRYRGKRITEAGQITPDLTSLCHPKLLVFQEDSSGIRPYTMPMMKLAATSIDQIPRDRDRVISTLLKYFHTDSLCLRAEDTDPVAEKQSKVWNPLLDWVETEIGHRPVVTTSIFGTSQPDHVIKAMEMTLYQCDDWQLAAIDWLAGTARSLVVALAIARGRLNIEEAIEVIRLEENHQVEEWGYVEGGHDIDEADIRVKISACSVFLRLL